MTDEVWKEIPGYAGYEVSDLGRVRSFRSPNGHGELKTTARVLRNTKVFGKKYLRVGLYRDAIVVYRRVHTLVLEAFVGPCPSNMECRHLDGNAGNNALTNLCWGTHQANMDDQIDHGTRLNGEKIGNSLITAAQARMVKDLLALESGRGSLKRVAEKAGVPYQVANTIKRGTAWKHI